MRFRFTPIRRACLAVVATASMLAFTGCSAEVKVGGGSGASGREIAGEIQKDYASKTGIELSRLTCESVDAEIGAAFDCSGRNARSIQLEISGKVTDTAGDGIEYSWHVVKAIAPGVFYERALRASIEEGGVALAEVRCPADVEIRVGAKLGCTATDRNSVSRKVTLRLTDLDGGFDYTVEGERPTGGSSKAS